MYVVDLESSETVVVVAISWRCNCGFAGAFVLVDTDSWPRYFARGAWFGEFVVFENGSKVDESVSLMISQVGKQFCKGG